MVESRKIRSWSRLGQSAVACGIALPEIMEKNNNIYAVTADLGHTAGMNRVMEDFSDRFINVGIAEQSLIGVAAGLSFEGANVFAVSFSTFLSMRGYEQIRHNLGYQRANVKLIGINSGVAMGMFGNTHYGLEDIAIMRAIPNMMVLSPADTLETYYMVSRMEEYEGPVYIRLSDRMDSDVVYSSEYDYEVGCSVIISEIKDINIIATGIMVKQAILARDTLAEQGIEVGVVDMHTIKPIDKKMLDQIKDTKLLITAEEHGVVGGMGAAIAEYYANKIHKPVQLMCGFNDIFPKPAEKEYIRGQYGINADGICTLIDKYMENI